MKIASYTPSDFWLSYSVGSTPAIRFHSLYSMYISFINYPEVRNAEFHTTAFYILILLFRDILFAEKYSINLTYSCIILCDYATNFYLAMTNTKKVNVDLHTNR